MHTGAVLPGVVSLSGLELPPVRRSKAALELCGISLPPAGLVPSPPPS